MKKENIIFIDTCIFEAENFFKGRNLNILLDLAKEKIIEIKITNIVYREILIRIENNSIKALNVFKKMSLNLQNEGKILKNVDFFKDYFKEIDIKKLKTTTSSNIKKQFNDLIQKNSIEIINNELIDAEKVINDYFETKPPFREGQKKNEFPDALSINSISNWCKKNNKKVFFITNDKDFKEYKDNNIDCSYNLSNLLELLYKENDDVAEFLTRIYEQEKYKIEDTYTINYYLDIALSNEVYTKLENDPWIEDVNVDISEIEDVEIIIAIINEVDDDRFSYEIEVDIIFTVEVEYTDLSEAYYNKENHFWIGEERKSDLKKYKVNAIIYPQFELDDNKTTGNYTEINSEFKLVKHK